MKYNSARRLHEIFKTCKKINSNKVIKEGFCEAFSISTNDNASFYERISDLYHLIDRVISDSKQLKDIPGIRDSLGGIRNIITDSFGQLAAPWGQFINQITHEMMMIIEISALQLDKMQIENSLDDEDLNSFLDDLNKLREKVKNQRKYEMPIRREILRFLDKLQYGIERYKMFGPDA
jgi:hypothetical protein